MAMKLLTTNTLSSSSESNFTSGIDSTYKLFIFKFYDIDPAAKSDFSFQSSTDGGSSYGVTKTTTFFKSRHTEADAIVFAYDVDEDMYQAVAPQAITGSESNDADASMAGALHLFNPSSTTYVKNFYSRTVSMGTGTIALDTYAAGYVNATAVVDAIKFQFASNDYDGTIKMWGVK